MPRSTIGSRKPSTTRPQTFALPVWPLSDCPALLMATNATLGGVTRLIVDWWMRGCPDIDPNDDAKVRTVGHFLLQHYARDKPTITAALNYLLPIYRAEYDYARNSYKRLLDRADFARSKINQHRPSSAFKGNRTILAPSLADNPTTHNPQITQNAPIPSTYSPPDRDKFLRADVKIRNATAKTVAQAGGGGLKDLRTEPRAGLFDRAALAKPTDNSRPVPREDAATVRSPLQPPERLNSKA